MAQVKYISVMLRGVSSKWLQNASRSPFKCAILLLYNLTTVKLSTDVHQYTRKPPYKWGFCTWSDIHYCTHCCSGTRGGALPALSLPPTHRVIQGSEGVQGPLSCTDSFDSFKRELLFPPVPVDPWSIPHFKWSMWRFFINGDGFVIASAVCIEKYKEFHSLQYPFLPSLPKGKYKST